MRHCRYVVFCFCSWVGLAMIPGTAGGAARRPYGGKMALSVTTAISKTDPAMIKTDGELELARQLHETLYRTTSSGIVPVLAQDMPVISRDGKEWTIHIRPGLQFHDGSDITSGELIASFHRLLDEKMDSPHWWLLAPVEGAIAYHRGDSTKISGLERINKLTFRIRLRVAMPGFIESLAAVPTAPLPARARAPDNQNPHPPGSGPFKWKTKESDSKRWLLSAFVYHPQGRPYLDQLDVVFYPSARAAGLAFELGKLHVTHSRPSHRVAGYVEVDSPQVWEALLALDPERAANMPEGFKRAIENAIDRRSLVKYLFGSRGSPTDEIISCSNGTESPSSLQPTDSGVAREYFTRLTVSSGGVPPVFSFAVRKGSALERSVAERIQVNLVDVGAVVSVIELDAEEYSKKVDQGAIDFVLERPIPLVSDPELQLVGILAGADELASKDVDLLEAYLRALASVPADGNRKALVREMARRYAVRLAWIPLFKYGRRACLQESVRGFTLDTSGQMDLAEIWLAR